MTASGVGPGEHGEKTGIWIINVLAATPRQIRGDAEGAVPSPDGSLIAFRNSTGTSNLSVVDPSGEHVRVLATASLAEGFGKLQWSPDGRQIAVLVRHIGDPVASIEGFDVDGGKRTVLARQEHLRTFVWLADGRFILAVQASENSGSYLYEVDAARNKRQLDVDAGVSVADMSATADGQRLAIVSTKEQADVYVASLRATGLSEPARLTLDDRNDHPTGWFPDGQTVLFESTRNGTLDVFRQRLEAAVAEQIAAGPDQQYGAEVTPDGATILYWSTARAGAPLRLLAVPIAGGAASPVLEAPAGSQFHCPNAGGKTARCVLLTSDQGKPRFELFDWRTAQREPLPEIVISPPVAGATPLWALSCDGTRIAFPTPAGLRVVDLRAGRASTRPTSGLSGNIAGIAFRCGAPDVLVATSATRENVLYGVRGSSVRPLWSSPRPISSPMPSPDGKRVLFGLTSTNSNAWLLENF